MYQRYGMIGMLRIFYNLNLVSIRICIDSSYDKFLVCNKHRKLSP